MGFAGQVFAARVAIGLAFPSPQAMGQASQIIGKGAAALYKKMNSGAVNAAKARRKNLESELSRLEQITEKHRASLDGKLTKARRKFVASMGQMNLANKVTAGKTKESFMKTQRAMGTAKTDKQLANTFAAGDEAFMKFAKHIKQRSPDLMIKIFDTDDLEKVKGEDFSWDKMAEGLHQAGKEGDKFRHEMQTIARLELENARRRKTVGMEEINMMRLKTKWLYKMGQIVDKEFNEAIELLDAEEQGFKDAVQAAEGHYSFINEGIRSYKHAYSKWDTERKEMEKDELSMKKLIQGAIKGEAEALKLLEQGMAKAAKRASQFAEALKTNFQNALRESISALTAMFYKLQQNTQELIEFERELMNANSVFNLTKKELFETSEVITQFGQTFGLEMQNGAEGLYQLASAGLTADESAKVLPETLKLSMAVQGDHNTIAKLTTQTLMGFSMEMGQAAEITDKFAHVIQKSLIEYEDLTSAVKFAMPFFTATGQSVDQLLGALTVLTNRALEAGIAGRGLRQALAEFAEHADNNEAAFARMGLEIRRADGSMKDLTVIAKEYSDIIGPEAAANTELLTALIDDLNVRGATAFVHLVQNADEFAEAVHNVENAGGELDEMVRIQNESMSAQIQVLKNNIQMLFFYNDGVDRANGAMNEFHSAIIDGITGFQDLLVEGEEGNKQLTEFGKTVQDVAVEAVQALIVLLQDGIKFLGEFSGQGKTAVGILKAYLLPIRILMKAVDFMGPRVTSLVIQFSMLNKLFSITAGLRETVSGFRALVAWIWPAKVATDAETLAVEGSIAAKTTEIAKNQELAASEIELAGARGTATSAAVAEAGAEGAGAAAGTGVAGAGMAGAAGAGGVARAGKTGATAAEVGKMQLKEGYTINKAGNVVGPKGGEIKPNKSGTFSPSKVKRFAAPAGASAGKGTQSVAKMGKLAATWQTLTSAGTYLSAAFVAVAAAFFAVAAAGLHMMGSLQPVVDILKQWGENIMWGIIKITMKIGLLPASMEGAALGVGNALKEMLWSFKFWGMRIAMMLGGVWGLAVWTIDQGLKSIGKLIDDAIGNSWLTDKIVNGFKNIWETLFDPEDGWLRWLTLTWWTDRFGELKDWITGYDWGAWVPDFGFAMPEWLTWDYWFGEDGIWSSLVAGFELFKADPLGTMVDMAKISMNAFINIYNEFAKAINGIKFEFETGGWDAKTMTIWDPIRGYSDVTLVPAFGGVGFSADMAGTMPIKDLIELRTGGYVRGMEAGGFVGSRQPYLVGEAGPELFMPNQSGQVINNSRTESILRNQLNSSRITAGTGSGQTLVVDTLVANESRMGKSKISVDTFAGVV